jgi:uncharacterized repeat protein (TIGR03899 family)
LYNPRAIRKEAEAEAYKKEVLAKAEAKKALIEMESQIELIERAKERLVNQEMNRQINLEEIAEKSIKYLDQNISEQPVDEDWRTRFFNKAQDVSDTEMQEIWAKILAGEVSHPKSVGLRTLDVISNISKDEAIKFQIACSLSSYKSLIWKIGNNNSLDIYGLTYGDLMILRDSGLIHDSDNLVKIFKIIPQTPFFVIGIGDDIYKVVNTKNPNLQEYKFNQIAFTKAGEDLCKLINVIPNPNYIEEIIKQRKSEGYELEKINQNKKS